MSMTKQQIVASLKSHGSVMGDEAAALLTGMDDALLSIKGLVTGDKHPRWKDDFTTTQTRRHIADLCDVAMQTNK